MLNRRTIGFLIFATAVVAGCLRLGVWQLSRLRERQAQNAELATHLAAPPRELLTVLDGASSNRLAAVVAEGEFDYANEFVLTARSSEGSPGVHVITPYKLKGTSRAILVNRGWVYAADGMTLNVAEWREPVDSAARIEGYLEDFGQEPSVVGTPSVARGIRRLLYDSLAARLPYPIEQRYVVQLRPNITSLNPVHPKRLRPPTLSEGSHRSYAIQWFSFALIGVVGMVAVVIRSKDRV